MFCQPAAGVSTSGRGRTKYTNEATDKYITVNKVRSHDRQFNHRGIKRAVRVTRASRVNTVDGVSWCEEIMRDNNNVTSASGGTDRLRFSTSLSWRTGKSNHAGFPIMYPELNKKEMPRDTILVFTVKDLHRPRVKYQDYENKRT